MVPYIVKEGLSLYKVYAIHTTVLNAFVNGPVLVSMTWVSLNCISILSDFVSLSK
jgi:hypothetical protein